MYKPNTRPDRLFVERAEEIEALEQQHPVGHLWMFMLAAVVAIAGILLLVFVQTS